MLSKPRILSFFLTRLKKSIKHEQSWQILYITKIVKITMSAPLLTLRSLIVRTSDTLIGYLPILQMFPKTFLCNYHWYPFK